VQGIAKGTADKELEGRLDALFDEDDGPGMAAALARQGEHVSPWLVGYGIELLRKLGQRGAAREAAALLTHPDSTVRFDTARLLGALGDVGVTDDLVGALGDEDETVQAVAAEALGKLRASRAVPALERLADQGDRRAAKWARRALAEIRKP
jgi:HEAT repeats